MRTVNNNSPLMDVGAFICSRRPKAGCQEVNCHDLHVECCDVPLEGRKQGELCGRRLCRKHALKQLGLCGPHARARLKERAAK